MRLFLSYSKEDREIAERIERKLPHYSLEIWCDRNQLKAGKDWPQEIGEVISVHDLFLLIWSCSAAGSRFVEFEWTTALALNRPIIICPLDSTPLPEALSTVSTVPPEELEAKLPGILESFRKQGGKTPFAGPSSASTTRSLLSLQAGDSIAGRYRVDKLIGRGGMGAVFLAEDSVLGRKVALKLLSEQRLPDPNMRARLIREAKLAAALDHPYICKVYELGTHDDQIFVILEYLEGETLRQRLDKGPLKFDLAVAIVREVAEALARAHAEGIVHRDLKPANVMLTAGQHVKVLDFGLAKRLPSATTSDLNSELNVTVAGTLMGTVPYMAPEQIRGEAADQRSDLFSLGVIFLECLMGTNPYLRENTGKTLNAILTDHPLDSRACRRIVPGPCERILRKLLEKGSEKRYPSAEALLEDLDKMSHEKVPSARRLVWPILLISVIGIGMIAVGTQLDRLENWLGGGPPPSSMADLEITDYETRARSLLENFSDPQDLHLSLQSWRAILDRKPDYSAALSGAAMAKALLAWNSKGSPGDLLEAEKDAQSAIEKDSSNAEAYAALAVIYQMKGLYSTAIEMSERSLDHGLDNPWILQTRARFLIDIYGRFREAEELASKACSLAPDHFPAWFQLGWAQFEMEKYGEAQKTFRKAVSLRPNFAGGHLGVGIVLSSSGQAQESLDSFEQCIEIDPDSVQCHFFRGAALHRTGLYEEALKDFEKVVEINPDHVLSGMALLYQALELKRFGRVEESNRLLGISERYFKETLTYSFGLRGMAGVEATRGNREKALNWLEQAVNKGLRSVHQIRAPDLDDLQGDPEFERILQKVRLENGK